MLQMEEQGVCVQSMMHLLWFKDLTVLLFIFPSLYCWLTLPDQQTISSLWFHIVIGLGGNSSVRRDLINKSTMWTGSWRMLVHILAIADVPFSKTQTPNTARLRHGICSNPFIHLLYTACLCVHLCVMWVEKRISQFGIRIVYRIKKLMIFFKKVAEITRS